MWNTVGIEIKFVWWFYIEIIYTIPTIIEEIIGFITRESVESNKCVISIIYLIVQKVPTNDCGRRLCWVNGINVEIVRVLERSIWSQPESIVSKERKFPFQGVSANENISTKNCVTICRRF